MWTDGAKVQNIDVPGAEDPIEAALFPVSYEATQALLHSGRRLVHYTSAEVAHSILTRREFWMRNAQTMNDYSEIAHGGSCLEFAAETGALEELGTAFEAIIPGAFSKGMQLFEGWRSALHHNTFLTCVSEHLGSKNEEDELGRLSMWRAYGGDNGVALILNPSFLDNVEMENVVTSPVFYATKAQFCEEVSRVAARISAIPDKLHALGLEALAANVFHIFRYAVLCTKHPGFREEREWRVIYTPDLGRSPYIKADTAVVRGVPQIIQKIQLVDDPDNGVRGIEPLQLIDGVLIGPSQFPMTLIEIFFHDLKGIGVENPYDRLRYSNIPLRR